MSEFDYVFSENGLLAYSKGKLISEKLITEVYPEKVLQSIVEFSLRYIADLPLPIKRGTQIEFRNGLINISPAGRNMHKKEFDIWVKHDEIHHVRETMARLLIEKFHDISPPLDFVIGGQSGFDIFPIGWDKSLSLQFLDRFHNIYFFGDRTNVGGNDYSLCVSERTFAFQVENPQHTVDIVKNIFFGEISEQIPEPIKPLTIGYSLPDKSGSTFTPFLHHFSQHGHKLVNLTVDVLKSDQTKLDLILHKFTKTLIDPESPHFPLMHAIQEYIDANRNCAMVDSFESVLKTINRDAGTDILAKLRVEHGKHTIVAPKSIVVDESTEDISEFPFPGVAKPGKADGSPESHQLSMIYNPNGIGCLPRPYVIEQFINHDGVLHKIYVINDFIRSYYRPSLPNVSQQEMGEHAQTGCSSFGRISQNIDHSVKGVGEPLPESLLNALAAEIKNLTGLTVYGIDMVTQIGTNTHYVVDINYFPSFKGVDDVLNVFRRYLESKARESRVA
eukprot:TRINITY_DN8063_c0_g1_i1.p1 TRINITY_DN8063_c0_g1~~TRINITY_DN8063_c0_g1_i1.p1  ORF type:complete len:563 (-),score=122.28 TRINITY_DN8063_c0_g1_i1:55-1563(-)